MTRLRDSGEAATRQEGSRFTVEGQDREGQWVQWTPGEGAITVASGLPNICVPGAAGHGQSGGDREPGAEPGPA